jgi:phosphatidylserine decarboxylase
MTKKTTENHPIALEGWPFILGCFFLSTLGIWTHWSLFLIFDCLGLFCVWFFRNPRRTIPQDSRAVLSPADGKILEVVEESFHRYCNGPCRRISVFMSPLNVHVNRAAMKGVIENVQYNPGRFLTAFHEKASMHNEQNAVTLRNEFQDLIVYVQIAGWLARRILCYSKIGDKVDAGEIYGLIRFGSRVDVLVPTHYDVLVKKGDIITSAESILARRPQ